MRGILIGVGLLTVPDVLEQEVLLDKEPEIEIQDAFGFQPRRENNKAVPNFIRRIRG